MTWRILANPRFSECTSLKRIFVGGENVTPELVSKIYQVLPNGLEVVNAYGPQKFSFVHSTDVLMMIFVEWLLDQRKVESAKRL